MRTEYGDELIYLVQPTRVDYSLYDSDTIRGIREGTFRTYYLATAKGTNGSLRIQLNRIQAERFTIYNGLQLVKDIEIDKLLEFENGPVHINVEKIDRTLLNLRKEFQ